MSQVSKLKADHILWEISHTCDYDCIWCYWCDDSSSPEATTCSNKCVWEVSNHRINILKAKLNRLNKAMSAPEGENDVKST